MLLFLIVFLYNSAMFCIFYILLYIFLCVCVRVGVCVINQHSICIRIVIIGDQLDELCW